MVRGADRIMKKIITIISVLVLVCLMIFLVSGCGKNDNKSDISRADSVLSESSSCETIQDEEIEGGTELDTPEADSNMQNEPVEAESNNVSSSNESSKKENTIRKDVTKKTMNNNITDDKSSVKTSKSQNNTNSVSNNKKSENKENATDKKASAPTKSDAQAYIGKSASSLISDIGAPLSTSYSSSCLGDGEDGELKYNGFTVYTYKEGNNENVIDVD